MANNELQEIVTLVEIDHIVNVKTIFKKVKIYVYRFFDR